MPGPVVLNPFNQKLIDGRRPGLFMFPFLILLITGIAGVLWFGTVTLLYDGYQYMRLQQVGISATARVIDEGHERVVHHSGKYTHSSYDLYWKIRFTDAEGRTHERKVFPGNESYAGRKTVGVRYFANDPEYSRLDIELSDNPWWGQFLLSAFMAFISALISKFAWQLFEQFMQERNGILIEGKALSLTATPGKKNVTNYAGTCSFTSPEGREVVFPFTATAVSQPQDLPNLEPSGQALWVLYWKDNSYRVL